MSVIFSYSLAVSVTLILGLCAYRLSPENRIRFSFRRMTLIAIFGMSLMLPLLPSMRSGAVAAEAPISAEHYMARLSPVAQESGSDIWSILLLVWCAGVAAVLLFCIISLVRIFLIIMHAEQRNVCGRKIYITADKHIAPFSLGNIIVVNSDDFDTDADIILSHEAGHIYHHHTLDMLMSQAVVTLCWYNPAAWMLRKELKTVHEYQADRYVIDRGNDTHEYQLFLVMKAARSTFPAIGSNLNKSRLKSRIRTMNSTSSLIPFSAIGLLTPTVAFVASFLLLSVPGVSAALRESAAAELTAISAGQPEDISRGQIIVTGVKSVKKNSRDSLKTINLDSVQSVSVDRKAGKTDIVLKDRTVMQVDNRELQDNDTMMQRPALPENNPGIRIVGVGTVKKKDGESRPLTVGKKDLDGVRIFVDGKEVSADMFSVLSPTMIEHISVDKSAEIPCIRVTLKKRHE